MATYEGNKVTKGTGTWYTVLDVETEDTGSSVKVTTRLSVHTNYAVYLNYCNGYLYSGSTSGASDLASWRPADYSVYFGAEAGKTVKVREDQFTVDKGNAAKTVYVKGSFTFNDILPGTSNVSASVDIPALVADKPTSCANVRVSDNRNDVSWTRGANADSAYYSQHIERSVDGGAWSEIAALSASATSYADGSTTSNHSYAYRVRAYNSNGYTAYSESVTTYNTPAAPTSVTASRTGETGVLVTIANPANTATALELQRSNEGVLWDTVQTGSGKVTELSDNPGGGTFYYRARNTRGSLASAWSPASNAVVTITPPAAPTLVSPASGAVVASSVKSVELSWTHNPVDGSAQTAAEVAWSTDGGKTWTTSTVGTKKSASITAPAVNSTVTWKVRTKGAHPDYGEWSANRVFSVKAAPTVYFSAPSDGFSLAQMPLTVRLSYSDQSGSLAASQLVVERNGATVYTRNMGASAETVIEASDWLPENGATYTLRADVRSSSTLTATAVRDFVVDFIPPMSATAEVTFDESTGFASLLLGIENDGDLAPVESISVWRVANGSKKLLADGLKPGFQVVDKHAPSNTDYSYEVVSFAASGAYSVTPLPAKLSTRWFYFYGDKSSAKGMWSPTGQVKAARPSKKRVVYAGRELPVSYDSPNFSDVRTLSLLVRTKAEADAFFDLVRDGGRCVYKSGDGDVIHADVEATLKPAYEKPTYYGTVQMNIVRIDGEEL